MRNVRLVTIYARFSNLEQRKGDSLRRQLDLCRKFAARFDDWEVVEPDVIDSGKSAWSGDNITTGNLGKWTAEAERGKHAGKILLVERLDRLSRRAPTEVFEWMLKMSRLGVSIATVDDSAVYEAGKQPDLAKIVTIITRAQTAHEESQKKSERLKEVFAERRSKMAAGDAVNFNRLPGWLEMGPDNRPREIPTRADIVRQIFARYADGWGRDRIAKKLNDDGVAQFGWGKQGWTGTTVYQILKNRAVIGEWYPLRSSPDREPVPGVYPITVSLEIFRACNDKVMRNARQTTHAGGAGDLKNLLAGIGKCGVCGGRLKYYTNQPTKLGVRDEPLVYLLCDAAKNGRCDNVARVNYFKSLPNLLDEILADAMDDALFARDEEAGKLTGHLAAFEHEYATAKARAGRFLAMLGDGDDMAQAAYDAAREDMKKAEAQAAEIRAMLEDANGRVSPEQHRRRVAEVRDLIDSPDLEIRRAARTKVMAALAGVIDECVVMPDRRLITRLVGGARRVVIDGETGDVISSGDLLPRIIAALDSDPVLAAKAGPAVRNGLRTGATGGDAAKEEALDALVRRRRNRAPTAADLRKAARREAEIEDFSRYAVAFENSPEYAAWVEAGRPMLAAE